MMVVQHYLFLIFGMCFEESPPPFFSVMGLDHSLWFSAMVASHLASRIIPPVLGPNISYKKKR